MLKVLIFWFLTFNFIISIGFSSLIDKILCEQPYVNLNGGCRVEGICQKGIAIVSGKNIAHPKVVVISSGDRSFEFTPMGEGEVKVLVVCLKPNLEVKKIRLNAKKQSFFTSHDFLVSMFRLQAGEDGVVISGTSERMCRWIYPHFNGTHYLIVSEVYKNDRYKCYGTPIEVKEIVLDKPANIIYTTQSCVCGKDILLEKVENGFRIRVKE